MTPRAKLLVLTLAALATACGDAPAGPDASGWTWDLPAGLPTPVVPEDNPMSADRVRWEHIQRVYEMCDRNVSETARRLSMHRRTLQRILAKRSPK